MASNEQHAVQTQHRTRILVVDDDPGVRELLHLYLCRDGFEVTSAADGREAMRHYHELHPGLIILDLSLPLVHGLEVCRAIRQSARVPIIMLTAMAEEGDRIGGLALGADDYITKPFSPAEVVARVKAVLRRMTFAEDEGEVIELPGLHIDRLQHRVVVAGEEALLTPTEFRLLWCLASQPEHVLSRDELAGQVLRPGSGAEASSLVALQIRRLRERLKKYEHLFTIATVWGMGYKLEIRRGPGSG
jgi:two-component system, OmpR family, response regulator ResD